MKHILSRYFKDEEPDINQIQPMVFKVQSTSLPTSYGVFQTKIKFPVNTLIVFTIEGYNNCGGKSIFTFLYSFYYNTTGRSIVATNPNLQTMDWLNHITTIGKEIAD